MEAKSVNVRNRDDVGSKNRGETIEFATVLQKMVALKRDRRLANTL
jgi:threonyl-tRNA synthetase